MSDIKTPYACTERMLPQMKGKLTIRNEKSSYLYSLLVMSNKAMYNIGKIRIADTVWVRQTFFIGKNKLSYFFILQNGLADYLEERSRLYNDFKRRRVKKSRTQHADNVAEIGIEFNISESDNTQTEIGRAHV